MVSYQPDHNVSLHDVPLNEQIEREYIRNEDGKLGTVVDTGHFRYTTSPDVVVWPTEKE